MLRFIQLQLFLTIISFPLLIAWGLPFSLMSPLSNLIFTPILTLFLLLSTFVFFTQLVAIPNGWLIILLEWVTYLWDYIISRGSNSWLIGFAQPPFWVFIIFIGIAFFVLQHRKLNSPTISSACFLLLLLIFTACLKFIHPTPLTVTQIPCNKGALTYITHKKTTVLLDPGFLGQRISAPTWVEYTLMSFLIKNYGHTTIDYLIVLQPGIVTFEAIKTLIQLAQVKCLYLIGWEGNGSKQLLTSYGGLRRICTQQNVKFLRIGNKQRECLLHENFSLLFKPLSKQLPYQEIKFPALELLITIDEQEYVIHPAKYKE